MQVKLEKIETFLWLYWNGADPAGSAIIRFRDAASARHLTASTSPDVSARCERRTPDRVSPGRATLFPALAQSEVRTTFSDFKGRFLYGYAKASAVIASRYESITSAASFCYLCLDPGESVPQVKAGLRWHKFV